MRMYRIFLAFFIVALFFQVSYVRSAESRLEQLASEGTAEQFKQYLMKSPRFTQKQLDSALFYAVHNPKPAPIIKMLVDAGANPNATPEEIDIPEGGDCSQFWGPIQIAASHGAGGDWTSFITLANSGAIVDSDMCPPYHLPHFVASFGNDAAVMAMVRRGIDKKGKDYDNLIPYDYAKKNKNLSPKVREMLR